MLMRLICTVCALAGISGSPIGTVIPGEWHTQVGEFIREGKRLMRREDLTDARNAILCAWVVYSSSHYTWLPNRGGTSDIEFLFPQGEASRLIEWDGGTRFILAKIRGDTFAVLWQVRTQRITAGSNGSKLSNLRIVYHAPFVAASGYRIAQNCGIHPDSDMSLVFYKFDPAAARLDDGFIEPSGKWVNVDSVNLNQLGLWRTVAMPYQSPTQREVRKMKRTHPLGKSSFTMSGLSGKFLYPVPPSRRGYIVWKIPRLPGIPGEIKTKSQISPSRDSAH